ncbi:hypothetical protein O6H91_10G084400 [Diphasiastrum complanatum]|uniref:Uncharacterized protein n=1 Tax=Diphasiastrum complanatum TaxID=34168 RepID=A0ACC2CJ54_DIPCM|nr:hypothetical protein O6H91_10G084400 [Diphasiastrum complanatum]
MMSKREVDQTPKEFINNNHNNISMFMNRKIAATLSRALMKISIRGGAGQEEMRRFSSAKGKQGMQLVFLGTSAALPTISRNTSCIALRHGITTYLFDCGEGSYRQLQKTPFRICKINKIFITHMHGDHVMGVPGFLCSIGRTLIKYNQPIEVYGPQGLRDWLRASLQACFGRVESKYMVHELVLKEDKSLARVATQSSAKNEHEDELPGEDIICSGDGLWHVCKDNNLEVKAGILQHNVPCWGYVVEEQIGRSNLEQILDSEPRCNMEHVALQKTDISSISRSEKEKLSNILGLNKRSRKVDVLVHEATIVREHDVPESILRTHSSSRMAGEFAKAINAKFLILTHFSGYILGRDTVLVDLVNEAKNASGKDIVIAAKDFLTVRVL